MKKICVIKTGGTIGSVLKGGVVSLDVEKNSDVSGLYCGSDIEFVVKSEFSMLSENLDFDSLLKIADMVDSVNINEFDGVIITHGTDTLAFTACYLSLRFANFTKPIVVVSANFPLENEKSNGKGNFAAAVRFISQGGESGVFVAYQNPGENVKIHRGEWIEGCRGKDGYFYSDSWGLDAKAIKKQFLLHDFKGISFNKVLPIKAIAPCDFSVFNLDYCDVVVCESFHSGTVKTSGENSFNTLIKKAEKKNIPLILTGISHGDIYSSMVSLKNSKNLILLDGSFVMGVVLGTLFGKSFSLNSLVH